MLAFKVKRYSEAEAICQGKQLRAKLSALRSGDFPLAPEENSILDVRLAHRDEAALYKQATAASQSTDVSCWSICLSWIVRASKSCPSRPFDNPISAPREAAPHVDGCGGVHPKATKRTARRCSLHSESGPIFDSLKYPQERERGAGSIARTISHLPQGRSPERSAAGTRSYRNPPGTYLARWCLAIS